mgnify:CR=1
MRIQPGYKSGDCKKFFESKSRLDLRSGRFFVSFIMKISDNRPYDQVRWSKQAKRVALAMII